jgi:hypothetical protein
MVSSGVTFHFMKIQKGTLCTSSVPLKCLPGIGAQGVGVVYPVLALGQRRPSNAIPF